MHLAHRLTELRREHQMSLKTLSQATSLSVLVLSSLERGRAVADTHILE